MDNFSIADYEEVKVNLEKYFEIHEQLYKAISACVRHVDLYTVDVSDITVEKVSTVFNLLSDIRGFSKDVTNIAITHDKPVITSEQNAYLSLSMYNFISKEYALNDLMLRVSAEVDCWKDLTTQNNVGSVKSDAQYVLNNVQWLCEVMNKAKMLLDQSKVLLMFSLCDYSKLQK